jgi:outer membrane immunogenic protein
MMKSVLTLSADRPPVRQTNATKGVWAFGMAALFAVASAPAFAADVPIRGPAAPPPYVTPSPYPYYNYNWTGFYIGANVGGAWESSTLTDNFFNVSFSDSRSGFIGGAQIGYNWQISPQLVVGVEWMFDGTDLTSDVTTVIFPTVITTSAKVDWITTLAGRLGWAANNWLFYGKAGGAWVHDSATVTATTLTGTFSASSSDTQGGWVVGAGIEYGFAANWTARIEWDHIGLNDVTHPGFFVFDTITESRRFDLLTFGLNYRF